MSGNSLNENAWVKLLLVPLISASLSAGTFYGIMRGEIAANTHRISQLETAQQEDDKFRGGGPRWTAIEAAEQSQALRDYTDRRIAESIGQIRNDLNEIRGEQKDLSKKLDRLIERTMRSQ